MEAIEFSTTVKTVGGRIQPPASKSESNRALVIHALSGGKGSLQNLSNARDTRTMLQLLANPDAAEWNVLDAGTTMRFLTAFTAVGKMSRVMTGTHRMKERPIALLVDALSSLGANISYLEKEGYPPILVEPVQPASVVTNHLAIRGDVSSQYITALLMIAPLLPQGLELELTGKVGSKPYISMTLELMNRFGVMAEWSEGRIKVPAAVYQPAAYTIESDWSAASYWYSLVALADQAEVELIGYRKESLQGDSIIASIMGHLGVATQFTSEGLHLTKTTQLSSFSQDFTDCPDLAQTLAVTCAAKGVSAEFSGLESLRIKETDRIAAIQNELAKFGANFIEIEKDVTYKVEPGRFKVAGQLVNTYKDHRMAMAFAPLAALGPLTIEDPAVVDKSYPHFWKDLSVLSGGLIASLEIGG
jgi:3-phosphoshikimate 1-carboxyvinyltransferase